MTSTISRPAIVEATPAICTLAGPNDSQRADEVLSPNDDAPAGPASRPTGPSAMPIGGAPGGNELTDRRLLADTRPPRAVGDQPQTPDRAAIRVALPIRVPLLDPALCLAADVLEDTEQVRTANENRLRQLTRSVEDVDGEMRGFGLDESHPDVARLAAMVETLKRVEHEATLQLQRQVRRHPLYGWVKAQRGVGEKQAARLLAAIGDPYVNSATGQPRTVSALWAYCGLHVLPAASHGSGDTQPSGAGGRAPSSIGQETPDARMAVAGGSGGDPGRNAVDAHAIAAGVAPKRRRGQQANWSTAAKTRAYLIAESCMKQLRRPCSAAAVDGRWSADHHADCCCSAYRVTYDRRREHTATSRPDWTDGHSHADALRVASKAILRDLWRAARDLRSTS